MILLENTTKCQFEFVVNRLCGWHFPLMCLSIVSFWSPQCFVFNKNNNNNNKNKKCILIEFHNTSANRKFYRTESNKATTITEKEEFSTVETKQSKNKGEI
ncbi:unnamed protein product [Ceratitis capitata]|uniref:(Mediterranean fruit fly) hypothetical protein n=1 Tax=Ceratitis capitata TaxID=7213 RepID=A0A811USF6_CERCA|nr:unnamed protein product [Ceratitis capitata]